MFGACKTQTGTVTSSENTIMDQKEINSSDCPSNGTCSVEVQKNKELEIQDVGEGKIFPAVVDGSNIVVEYTYLRPGPEGTADANYFETIQFEIPAESKNLVKENAALADVKMMFGKHGFRLSGYYPVTVGKLSVRKTADGLSFDLHFKVDQTSHVISHIRENAKIE